MEILSDTTFKGNVTFNKEVTIGSSARLLSTNDTNRSVSIFKLSVSEFSIRSDGNGGTGIGLHDRYLKKWSDLNDILDFAPKSLSTTVNSNTSKINSACSTISSLCTKVNSLCTTVSSNTNKINSLCTTVADLPAFSSVKLDFDVPSDCTRFFVYCSANLENAYYMFMTKGTNPMSPVNIDLELRHDSTTDNYFKIIATKSSGLTMCVADNYTLGYFYKQ